MGESGDTSGDTITAKSVAMVVLFCASMTLGTVPIKLSKWFKWDASSPQNNLVVQLLLCLGGGVLLCTTFLHLLPEVAKNIEELEDLPDIGLPLAETLMCIGFFVMYFVEECAHVYIHKRENASKRPSFKFSATLSELNAKNLEHSLENPKFSITKQQVEDHDHAGHSHLPPVDGAIATLRGLLVVLALSVHELFEGLAVGLESSPGHVWYMFGAVSAHKLVIAFCIGVELVTSGMKTLLVVIYVFTFAVVSPMGIGIGMAVSKDNESSTQVPSVLLQGLASGTLLYVVFFEILRTERKSGIRQYFAVLLGFIIMLCITLIGD